MSQHTVAGFEDELEKIADGMSVKKITDAGRNVALNIARAPAARGGR